ncbi:MAG: RloB domain-containing protein [Neisseriaceae bacterium]|nr:RloB domain-containing protein [Neisseriaceae bacterium]
MAKHEPKSGTPRRNAPKRELYDRVLIVCEDGKSAPYYFEHLRNIYKLSTANIEITGKCGSAPKSVLEYAKERKEEEIQKKNPFSKIFCVFDKDKHETYNETVKELKKLSNDSVWETALINSVPCFEYWCLLHFKYVRTLFPIYEGKDGVSKPVIEKLKEHIPEYEKGKNDKNIFQQLYNNLPFAIKHAKQSLKDAETTETDNPTTKVHLLVEYLQELNLPIAIKHIETLLSQAQENKMDNVKIRVLEQYLNQLREKQKLKK